MLGLRTKSEKPAPVVEAPVVDTPPARSGEIGSRADAIDARKAELAANQQQLVEVERRLSALHAPAGDIDAAVRAKIDALALKDMIADLRAQNAKLRGALQRLQDEITPFRLERQQRLAQAEANRRDIAALGRSAAECEKALEHLHQAEQILKPISRKAIEELGHVVAYAGIPVGKLHNARQALATCERRLRELGDE